MEDEKIVDLYWRRDENAIRETADKYGGYCRTVAYHILEDAQDAEECDLGKLTRWISLSRLRERRSLKRGGGELPLVLDELAEVMPSGEDVEKRLEMKELAQAVRAFLGRIDETQAQVFLSRYWYIASVAEIAEKFGFTESKVTAMLHRTRTALRRYLKEEGLC